MRRGLLGRGLIGAVAAASLLVPASAAAITYAPPDHPGPPLSVPQNKLNASLECPASLAGATRTPVLFVPGTGSDPEHNFSWNWEPALDDLGIPWCAVTVPDHALGDVQVAGEYVVNAIRTMYQQAGRKISIIGHSQGGMLPRWPLRFWPDTRAMVDDQIGFAPSNHGTTGADALCAVGCAAADWQQRDVSEFIKALNSFQETFAGISYTEIYSHFDEIVTPNSDDTGSSSLHTGDGAITNEAVQQICPADPSEHLALGTQDNVAYDLAIDALEHPGPADPARVQLAHPDICTQPLMPGIDPLTYAADLASAAADLGTNTAAAPHLSAEPPLACYVTASCGQGGQGGQGGNAPAPASSHKCKKHKKRHHRAAESKKRHSCKKHKKRHRR